YVAEVPTNDICSAAKSVLFDHLVGEQQKRFRNSQAHRLSSLEVHDQLVASGQLEREIAGFGPLDNAIHQPCRLSVYIDQAWSIDHEAARFRELPPTIDGRQFEPGRHRHELYSGRQVKRRLPNEQTLHVPAFDFGAHRIEITVVADLYDFNTHADGASGSR